MVGVRQGFLDTPSTKEAACKISEKSKSFLVVRITIPLLNPNEAPQAGCIDGGDH